MQDWFDQIDINQYLPSALSWATNILLALLILIIGFWIAGRVGKSIRNAGERNERLDDTLFRFMGSVAKYVILAFVIIAVLNRFGVETTSIVALLGAASGSGSGGAKCANCHNGGHTKAKCFKKGGGLSHLTNDQKTACLRLLA